jgi:hypothetical protein
LASKTQAYLAKPVRKTLGSRILRNPPAPAPYAQNVAAQSYGETACVIQCSGTRFSVGFAESADCDSPTPETLRGLGADLSTLKGWKGSH